MDIHENFKTFADYYKSIVQIFLKLKKNTPDSYFFKITPNIFIVYNKTKYILTAYVLS